MVGSPESAPYILMWLSLFVCAVSLQGQQAHWIRIDLEEHILPQPPLQAHWEVLGWGIRLQQMHSEDTIATSSIHQELLLGIVISCMLVGIGGTPSARGHAGCCEGHL